jgi:hypothetical protein
MAPVLREVAQFIWRVTRQADLSTLERADTEQDTPRRDLGRNVGSHRFQGITSYVTPAGRTGALARTGTGPLCLLAVL